MTVTYADIEAAARRLTGQVLDTPCVESKTLGQIVGAQVFLKFETCSSRLRSRNAVR
jgi:threonine dehydratase